MPLQKLPILPGVELEDCGVAEVSDHLGREAILFLEHPISHKAVNLFLLFRQI